MKDYFSKVPNDIASMVMGFIFNDYHAVDACLQTSKRFQNHKSSVQILQGQDQMVEHYARKVFAVISDLPPRLRLPEVLRSVKKLDFSWLMMSQQSLQEMVAAMPDLEELNLSHVTIDGNWLCSLVALSKLQKLNLEQDSDKDFSSLASLSSLVDLNLSYTNATNDMLEKIIPHLTNLQKLHLGHTSITDKTIQLILSHLPYLTQLSLGGCSRITEQGKQLIASRSGIKFDLSRSSIKDAALRRVKAK
jgi:hypothetical protein